MLLLFSLSPDEITVGHWSIFSTPAWNQAGELKIWSRRGKTLTQPHRRVAQDMGTKSTAVQLRLCLPAQKTSLKQSKNLLVGTISHGRRQIPAERQIQSLLLSSRTCPCLFPNLETTMVCCLRSPMQSNHREILWCCGNSPKEKKTSR